jgi:diacylglycerol O-acyltransferase
MGELHLAGGGSERDGVLREGRACQRHRALRAPAREAADWDTMLPAAAQDARRHLIRNWTIDAGALLMNGGAQRSGAGPRRANGARGEPTSQAPRSHRRRMPSADVAWLHMDRPTNVMSVNVVLCFDTPVDWEQVKEICRDRVVERFPRFSQLVVESLLPWRPVTWEDDPRFDLERHFHRLALRAPGDRAALLELMADLTATPLDRHKPLWDMYLVEGYGRGCAIVSRVHHSIADGIALARVMLALTDDEPDRAAAARLTHPERADRMHPVREPDAAVASRVRHAAETLIHGIVHLAGHPRQLSHLIWAAEDVTRAMSKPVLAGPAADTVLKGELGVAQRVASTRPIRLADVKRTAHATGTTVNDVMLGAATGALRSYLLERDNPVVETRAVVPFNLRPLGEPIPRELGNRFGLALLTLPIDRHHPHERLAEVHHRMAEIKHSPEGAISYGMLSIAGMMPLAVERVIVDRWTAKAVAVMTNVPGPPHPVYLAGAPVLSMLAWAPKPGSLSMSVTIFSYNGEIAVSLATDAGLIPDPERIVAGVERELAELQRPAPRTLASPGGQSWGGRDGM